MYKVEVKHMLRVQTIGDFVCRTSSFLRQSIINILVNFVALYHCAVYKEPVLICCLCDAEKCLEFTNVSLVIIANCWLKCQACY